MNILAFDTTGESCSVAIKTAEHCFEKINHEPRKQAERLLPMIDDLLVQANLQRSDLDGLALTHGPGAFTGVRIAIAAAQGIAYALDLPVVTVSTLAALAQGAHRKFGWKQVLSALDARMGEVYWGAYQADDSGLMQSVHSDAIGSPSQVHIVDEPRTGWYGAGSGWGVYLDQLPPVNVSHVLTVEAFDIITLALPLLKSGHSLTAEEIKPVYLRNKVVRS
ncbi:MAG: tRNA (adenosine(37)-N6)-threonylcarbamoyltransferase complex dimerization subunit type 1 TsaB [Legionellales bacterium]|nr:tRNA (adenosine(37)-N6)-threonylcarbamoyltransferase complex dimerization subunit type 1 TsaB [Legionellales bacterium]